MTVSKRSGKSAGAPKQSSVLASARAALRSELESMNAQTTDLAAGGGMDAGGCVGAGITNPATGGRTGLALQKFRVNWMALGRDVLCSVAMVLAERHWFIRPVVRMNVDLYGLGFRFVAKETREWLKREAPHYPFKRVHRDLLREFMTNQSVVAMWPKSSASGELPVIEVPDVKDAKLLPGGVLSMKLVKNSKLSEEAAQRVGEKMAAAIRGGKIVEISPDDPIWAFRVMTDGKISSGLTVPSMTGILDDLDYIEAVRIGDWNGAWQRRKMLLHATKGYGISSGGNAGQTRGHAKKSQLDAVAAFLKALTGSASLATNFDQEFKHVVFPKDFFSDEMTRSTWERLLLWSGFAGVLLFKSESQIAGVSPYLMLQLRTSVFSFRELWSEFIMSIFGSPEFHGGPAELDFTPAWSIDHLYSVDELQKLIGMHTRAATLSPQSLREFLSIDNAREVERMKSAHADRQGYIPVFEPNQGLGPQAFPEEFPGASGPGGGGGDPAPVAGPGRPSSNSA